MSLTHESLSRIIASQHEISFAESRRILTTVLSSVTDSLVKGDTVKLHGLATLQVKERSARKQRNPRTGEYFDAPAKNVVKVKVAKRLAERVAADI